MGPMLKKLFSVKLGSENWIFKKLPGDESVVILELHIGAVLKNNNFYEIYKLFSQISFYLILPILLLDVQYFPHFKNEERICRND